MDYEEYDDEYDDFEDDNEISPEEQELMEEEELSREELRELKKREQKLKKELQEIHRKIKANKEITTLPLRYKSKVDEAKEFKSLNWLRAKIKGALLKNKWLQFLDKLKHIGAWATPTSLTGVIVIGLVIVVVICAAAIIASAMGEIGGDGTGSGGSSSIFGITGDDFYGARMIYKDDEKASESIIENYVETVELGVAEANKTSLDNLVLTINLNVPSEEYKYSEFDEASFSLEYPELYQTILKIAQIVYVIDNSETTAPTTLLENVNGIKYFGIVKADLNSNGVDDITETIKDAIFNNSSFRLKEGDSNPTELEINSAKEKISTSLTTLYANEKYALRVEKLFVKDIILDSDEEMITGVTKENYVAMIFMPKKNVSFSQFSFYVGCEDVSNFTMQISENGNSLNVESDGTNYGIDDNVMYLYKTADNLTISATTFTDIDVENLNALSSGLSLIEIVENLSETYSTYLETKQVEGSFSYLTIKKNGVVINMENDSKFSIIELETIWA